MRALLQKTGERLIPGGFASNAEYLLFLRHQFAYEYTAQQLTPTDHVMDAGCGEGYGTFILSQHVNETVGLDVDPDTVRHATAQYGTPQCRFQIYDGRRFPFPDQTFEAVVSFQVIEHIVDDAGYLLELNRILKVEGRLILTTPNRLYRLNPGQKPWNRFHVREYEPEQLRLLLSRHFEESRVLGVMGTEEINRFERERVDRRLTNRIKRRLWRRFDPSASDRYSLDGFHVTHDAVHESLDLLGICVKRR